MVKKLELPDAIAAEFRRSIDTFLHPEDPARQRLKDVPLIGIPVIQLDLDNLKPGSLTSDMEAVGAATGWLVLAQPSDGAVYGAEIMPAGPNGAPETGGIWRDPAFPEFLNQLEQVVHLSELKGQENFQMKLISIPALLTEALWLSAGEKQFVIPVRVQDELLPLMQPIRVDNFFQNLAQIAPAFREFDDLPPEIVSGQP